VAESITQILRTECRKMCLEREAIVRQRQANDGRHDEPSRGYGA